MSEAEPVEPLAGIERRPVHHRASQTGDKTGRPTLRELAGGAVALGVEEDLADSVAKLGLVAEHLDPPLECVTQSAGERPCDISTLNQGTCVQCAVAHRVRNRLGGVLQTPGRRKSVVNVAGVGRGAPDTGEAQTGFGPW